MNYPDDFDGVVAGNPWIDQAGNALWNLRNIKAFSAAWIPPSTFPLIEDAVFAQCDMADGVKDRLIQNPAICSFDPNTLVPQVLNRPQANALKTYMTAIRNEKGRLIFPGGSVRFGMQADIIPYSADPATASAPPFPTGPQPWGSLNASSSTWTLAYGVMAYFGYRDPAVNLMGNQVIDQRGRARSQVVQMLYNRMKMGSADEPEALRRYIARGGKLLIYDGYADPTLNAYDKITFYRGLAQENGGYERVQRNVRMFMAPDMAHCFGGSGPNTFDALTALEDWVERRQAPDYLLASHSTGKVIDRTMPICMFPRQAKYSGSGDVNDARNWSCPPNQKLLEVGPNGISAGLGEPFR